MLCPYTHVKRESYCYMCFWQSDTSTSIQAGFPTVAFLIKNEDLSKITNVFIGLCITWIHYREPARFHPLQELSTIFFLSLNFPLMLLEPFTFSGYSSGGRCLSAGQLTGQQSSHN